MYTYDPCHVLLIDDDRSVLDIVQALLAESKPVLDTSLSLFHVEQVENLAAGVAALAQQPNRIVLLDLNLPDSQGTATLTHVQQRFPHSAIVVLTGLDDDVVAVRAIEAGARGFLNKDNLDPNLLAYALLLAAEQQRQLQSVPAVPRSGSRTQGEPGASASTAKATDAAEATEIENFERLAYSVRPVTVTSQLFESGLLKDTVPDIFSQMVDTYCQILDGALEQKTFRVDYPISENLRSLAEQLGFLKAGARDVVELHTLALKQKGETENVLKAQAYAAEGRLVVLELMGYLMTYYRKYFTGLSKLHTTRPGKESL